MKKKFISCLCMAIAVMSLFGCGGSAKTDNNSPTDETVASVKEKENTTKKADEKTIESSSEEDEKEGTFYILNYDGSRCYIPVQPGKEYHYFTDDTEKKYRNMVFCDYEDYHCTYSDSTVTVDKNNGLSLEKIQKLHSFWSEEVKSTDINGKTIYYGYFSKDRFFNDNAIYAYEDVGNSTYIEMYVSLKGTATLSEDEVINVIKEFVIQ